MTLPGSGGMVTYQYDPFGRRIENISSSGTTIYAYDGDNVVEELDGGGTAVARYTQGLGIDEPLAMYRGGASYYYNADGLGSITSLTNSSGQIAASYTYDSFGKLTASTGTVTNPFRYTGREYGSDTGLYYYRARYYDSSVGRFISEDPIGWVAGPNVYGYVANDPWYFTDPEGLKGQVSQSGNTITVSASITLYGPRANAGLAAKWQQMINNAWNSGGNSFHVGHCTVVFKITVNADPAHNKAAQATPADNKIYVRPNGFRSWVAGTPGASYGEWAADAGWSAEHETGHLFHLPDDYHDTTVNGQTVSVPNPGHAGHMMGDYGGTVSQHEIDDLLHNNGCGCNHP